MGSQRTYLDTGGLFSVLVPSEAQHERARSILRDGGRIFYTTDWVIGETVNLLTARRRAHIAKGFLRQVGESTGIQITYGSRELFEEAKALLLKYDDQAFSFTDCVSFAVMRSLKIREALTSDGHFKVMGFVALLG